MVLYIFSFYSERGDKKILIFLENNADELVAKKLTPNDIIESVKVDLKSDDKIRGNFQRQYF